MRIGKTTMNPIAAKDLLVKVLATVFLNPTDRNRRGRKVLIQQFLGCGCPDEVVEQATVRFFFRPLGSWLERRIISMEASSAPTPLEKKVNALMKLPKNLTWPRLGTGRPALPAVWQKNMLGRDAINAGHVEKLISLRQMSNATIDAVIEVPGRAFFFLVAQDRQRLKRNMLRVQYESGQLLYQLMGYNRCRLFTITEKIEPKIIPQIDTALSWQGLFDAFCQVRHEYVLADTILKFFEPEH